MDTYLRVSSYEGNVCTLYINFQNNDKKNIVIGIKCRKHSVIRLPSSLFPSRTHITYTTTLKQTHARARARAQTLSMSLTFKHMLYDNPAEV